MRIGKNRRKELPSSTRWAAERCQESPGLVVRVNKSKPKWNHRSLPEKKYTVRPRGFNSGKASQDIFSKGSCYRLNLCKEVPCLSCLSGVHLVPSIVLAVDTTLFN